jgi:hypothetical protein
MSSRQRLLVVAAAVVVAVIAFVVVRPGDDDKDKTSASETAPQHGARITTGADQVTPSPPAAQRIVIRDNKVVSGPTSIKVTKGDHVRIVVSTNQKDDLHLHGYDIEKTGLPGKPVTFVFDATIEGKFELESHTAEDAGLNPKVADILVEPS